MFLISKNYIYNSIAFFQILNFQEGIFNFNN